MIKPWKADARSHAASMELQETPVFHLKTHPGSCCILFLCVCVCVCAHMCDTLWTVHVWRWCGEGGEGGGTRPSCFVLISFACNHTRSWQAMRLEMGLDAGKMTSCSRCLSLSRGWVMAGEWRWGEMSSPVSRAGSPWARPCVEGAAWQCGSLHWS